MILDITLVCGFCISRKGEREGGVWGNPQGDVHMTAARLGSKRAMVGLGWANSLPGCINRCRKHTLTFYGTDLWQGKLLRYVC